MDFFERFRRKKVEKAIPPSGPAGIIPPPPAEGKKLLVRPSKKGEKGKEEKPSPFIEEWMKLPKGAAAKEEKKSELNDAEALNKKGMELAAKGELGKADGLFQKAIALKPDWTWPRYNLGEVLRNKGFSKAAIHEYDGVLKINPKDAGALNGKGMCLMRFRGKEGGALLLFKIAAEISPGWTWPWYNIGEVYLNWEQCGEARSYFEKVLQLNPKDEWAILLKGVAILKGTLSDPYEPDEKRQRFKEALKIFKKLLDLNPKFTEARFYKGIAMIYVHGTTEETIKALTKGAELMKKAGKLKPMPENPDVVPLSDLRVIKDYEAALVLIKVGLRPVEEVEGDQAIRDELDRLMAKNKISPGGRIICPDCKAEIDITDPRRPLNLKCHMCRALFTIGVDGLVKIGTTIKCPRCLASMVISAYTRPFGFSCDTCGANLGIDKDDIVVAREEPRIVRLRCPKCQEIMDITSTKRPLEVRCSRCNAKLMLRT